MPFRCLLKVPHAAHCTTCGGGGGAAPEPCHYFTTVTVDTDAADIALAQAAVAVGSSAGAHPTDVDMMRRRCVPVLH